MNGLQAIKTLAVYIAENIDIDGIAVFKSRKLTSYSDGSYIVVNSLPFTTAYAFDVLNVNLHVPALTTGEPDTLKLEALQQEIERIIPAEVDGVENPEKTLTLNGVQFARYCDSNPMSDADNTFFINIKVKVYNYYV